MKLLVIGGSNSVMAPGYVGQACVRIKEKSRQAPKLTNISVGANNCLIGLENLKELDGLGPFDKVVVEFAINDFSLATPDGFETWQCAYEGLLRHILRLCPDAQVFHLVLGRRAERKQEQTARIRDGMKQIVNHYKGHRDVRLLDFDGYLRKRLENDQARIEQHYSDDAHYDFENGIPLLSRYVAHHLTTEPLPASSTCPPPRHADVFDRAQLHRITEMPVGLEVRAFENTRFVRKASALKPGEGLAVELPGPLICLSFQSTADSRPLLVEEEGEAPVLFFTANAELKQTPDKFRIKNFTFEWKKWAGMARKGPRRVTLTAIERDDIPRFERFLVNRYNMVPGWGEGRGPYVSNLMYLPPAEAPEVVAARVGDPAAVA
ncbi:SGNH/GDSL hydrolase family protein [Ancylobacter sp. Lp-2]|uniref:SGNH/GDSL hydrolase family protein n=1 Tax=Ancylobacter sp. Lp-2 TaxID=2881339 RepID=UPI001E474777|nr:SGNH/GDSL hydrolase family protein [Ancylobacter sp. Lp-2]MCB4768844.1 SGNH/GDSL hydrolase family protein [Ancylobacter sp. Lp-2]